MLALEAHPEHSPRKPGLDQEGGWRLDSRNGPSRTERYPRRAGGAPCAFHRGCGGRCFTVRIMNGSLRRKAGTLGVFLDNLDMHGVSAQSVMDAVGAGMVVLDRKLTVRSVNRAFCALFSVTPEQALGRGLLELCGAGLNSPTVKSKLEALTLDAIPIENLMVEADLPGTGRRMFKLEGRRIDVPAEGADRILLTFADVSKAVAADLHKDLLAAEMAHRIKNSLSVLASFLTLEISRGPAACRESYRSMQTRLSAVASLYDMIARSNAHGPVDMRAYLCGIGAGLRASLIGQDGTIQIAVDAQPLAIEAGQAVSIGLLVNELATNAIKHAFPQGRGRIVLGFHRRAEEVTLTVQDDGIGIDAAAGGESNAALGMRFVEAFVQQLGGALTRASGRSGTTVSVRLPISILATEEEAGEPA